MTRVLTLLALLTACSACTPFPRAGTGGFAEHRPTVEPYFSWDPAPADQHRTAAHQVVRRDGRWAVLHDKTWTAFQIDRLDCADLRLDSLKAYEAVGRYPAHVWRAERARVEVLRTLSAGLEFDGERALSFYEDVIAALAERLDINPEEVRHASPETLRRTLTCSPIASASRT